MVYGCTTGSLVKGPGHDKAVADRLRRRTGIEAIATATAVVEALEALKARRIALATPYIDEVNERERIFLEARGFKVVDLKALGIRRNTDIGRQAPETVYRLVRSLNTSNVDAVFISCTNLPTLPIIGRLEEDLGIPVISSNTATMWLALRKLGIGGSLHGYGRLLEEPRIPRRA